MKTYFKLFRAPNLLIIIVLEYLLKTAVFEKLLSVEGIAYPINQIWFGLFVVSTVFVAIAGYIVNDIADVEIDKINRPDRALSSGVISISQAKSLQWFFEIAAIILGFSVAYHIGQPSLVNIHILLIFLLRTYAKKLKCKGLIGNITVAISTATVPAWVWIYSIFALQTSLPNTSFDFSFINLITLFYIGFAFIFTLIREIVKDLEDLKGDKECNCNTLAVSLPLQKVKNWVIVLNAIAIQGILVFIWLLFNRLPEVEIIAKGETLFAANFISIAIVILIHIIPKTIKANSSLDFHKIGNTLKIVMVAGIAQMLFLLM
ncbi:MAG: hypothetical protein DSY76_03740 [Bacteroidetes bacterium]|nr:MAG: hypothetical protein DSY76_03740 [Bacteroidota bacterium]